MQKRISKISLVREPDYDADLSFLGTFGDEAKSRFAIEHEPNNPRSFNYFNPQDGTCETKEHAQQAYDRLMDYERGMWQMESVKAVADIQTSPTGGCWLTNRIESSGLYGLESDMPQSEFKEIEAEQLDELAAALEALGFTREEIEQAKITN